MALLERPQGTEDILPVSSAEWIELENFLRRTALCYGFREIRVPTFEKTELFSRGVGETTDVVQKGNVHGFLFGKSHIHAPSGRNSRNNPCCFSKWLTE